MCHASAIGTSSNSLAGKFIREGSPDVKMVMENLLEGGRLHTKIDEQIVFSQLDQDENAIWSRLVASGYLKVENYMIEDGEENYELSLTNKEVRLNNFLKALLQGDEEAMNAYMNRVSMAVFSYFDTGSESSEASEPERFYDRIEEMILSSKFCHGRSEEHTSELQSHLT